MKPTRLICAVAATLLTAFAPLSAAEPSDEIGLRYLAVGDVFDAIKQQLGREAGNSVLSFDKRTNSIKVDDAHPDAVKVRELIKRLDQRPQMVHVAATIKRVIPGTPTEKAREQVIARPTLMSATGRPMSVTFQDAANGTIKLELTVTALPPEQGKR